MIQTFPLCRLLRRRLRRRESDVATKPDAIHEPGSHPRPQVTFFNRINWKVFKLRGLLVLGEIFNRFSSIK